MAKTRTYFCIDMKSFYASVECAERGYDEQEQLLLPLNALNAEFSIIGDGQKHYVQVGSQKKEIVAYPAMWSEYSRMLPRSGVAVSDKMLKYALPKVDAIIRGML